MLVMFENNCPLKLLADFVSKHNWSRGLHTLTHAYARTPTAQMGDRCLIDKVKESIQ